MLDAYGLWAGRDLYRATPAVTRGLGFCSLVPRPPLFDRFLQQARDTQDLFYPGVLRELFNRDQRINENMIFLFKIFWIKFVLMNSVCRISAFI